MDVTARAHPTMANPSRTRNRLFNRVRLVLDRSLTAANALDLAYKAHPDTPLFYLDSELPYVGLVGREITSRQLLSFVNRIGNILIDKAGMKRYDRVAIFKSNAVDYFFLAIAIIKAGGIAVPMNSGMGLGIARTYLQHTGSKILLTDRAVFSVEPNPAYFPTVETWIFPDAPQGFGASHVDLNLALERTSAQLEPVPLTPVSDILIVHTSGTTGPVKAVISTSGTLIHAVKGHFKEEPISTSNRIAVVGHFNHLVYYVGLFASMLGNLRVWTVTSFNPKENLQLIARQKINIFFAFPDVYLRMYEEGLDRYDLSSMRIWITTADASHEVHMRAFCQVGAYLRLLGFPIIRSVFIEAFGTSEIGCAALRRFYFSFSKLRLSRLIGRATPAGPQVKIADENGRAIKSGQVGRLVVKGKTLFKGYWSGHDCFQAVTHCGWWWTGDVVYRDRLGRFYHLDRATDIIHTRCGPVYTLLAEEFLLTHPDVAEAVVFGVPTPGEGEIPFGLVTAKQGHALDSRACCEWVANSLNLSMPIKRIAVVAPDCIPRGLTGKVLKRVLRERYATCFTGILPQSKIDPGL